MSVIIYILLQIFWPPRPSWEILDEASWVPNLYILHNCNICITWIPNNLPYFVESSGFSGYDYSDIWDSRWQWTHSNHQRQLQLFLPSFSKELKLLACVPGPVSEMLWRYLWWLILNGNITKFRITQKLHLRAVLVLPRLCFLTLQDLNKQRQNNTPQLWYKISPCSLKHFLIRLDVITIRKATLSQCPDSEIYSSLTTFLNTILCTFLWISCELYKLSILQFLIFSL